MLQIQNMFCSLEHSELMCGFTWLICSCTLKLGLFSKAMVNDFIIYGIVDLAFGTRVYFICLFFVPLCFLGDDFSIIQQEIFMVKECTHHNIVAYFGSYLWYGQNTDLFLMKCLVIVFTGSGSFPFCHIQSNFWSLGVFVKDREISADKSVSKWR